MALNCQTPLINYPAYCGIALFTEVAYKPIIAPVNPRATSVDKMSPETTSPKRLKLPPLVA